MTGPPTVSVYMATKQIVVSQVIDGSLGAYAAGDVVGADDCCTTLAVAWEFDTGIIGASGEIREISLFNETENQPVQYDLDLYNATPTCELRDNAASTSPLKADRLLWIDRASLPTAIARGAAVATTTRATPSTSGGLPITFKCADDDSIIYGVLITRTAYTQTATDDITIKMDIALNMEKSQLAA